MCMRWMNMGFRDVEIHPDESSAKSSIFMELMSYAGFHSMERRYMKKSKCHHPLLQLDLMRLLINTVFDLKMLNRSEYKFP